MLKLGFFFVFVWVWEQGSKEELWVRVRGEYVFRFPVSHLSVSVRPYR